MAEVHSPAHKIGQIIGDALELSVYPVLLEVASKHGLYVDQIGPRTVRGGRRKITWKDNEGNSHDLDFVFERGGSDSVQGAPVAFIEVAWRRYTKHSKNKAGEIANALLPLLSTHATTRPLLGAVVAGDWTAGGLDTMKNQGLKVLHIPRSAIIHAFSAVGMDVDYGETTLRESLADQVRIWNALDAKARETVGTELRAVSPSRYGEFRRQLDVHFERQILRILVLTLHGSSASFDTADNAIAALKESLESAESDLEFIRIEVQVTYNNGDEIRASFQSPLDAVAYLEVNV